MQERWIRIRMKLCEGADDEDESIRRAGRYGKGAAVGESWEYS
jgi:hypothetical protein